MLVTIMLLTELPAFPSRAFKAAVNRAEADMALLHPVSLGIGVALDLAYILPLNLKSVGLVISVAIS